MLDTVHPSRQEGGVPMTAVTELNSGMTIRLDERLYRILDVVRHSGSGQMHGFIELKLKEMRFGHLADLRFKQADRVEVVDLAKRSMDFLYADAEKLYFMDPRTFEQVGLNRESIGAQEKLLKEGSTITVELLGEDAIAVQFPKVVAMAVVSTGPGIHDGQDNTMKPAVLENDIDILVPQFVVSGDHVRIDTERMKYIDRVAPKRL
jgi:elongation factor P